MQKVVSAANPNAVVKGTSSNTAQTLVELGAVIAIDNSLGSGGGSIRQATFATVSVETNAVRFSFGTPTTAVGHLVQPGDVIELEDVYEIAEFKAISAVAGAHGVLQISTEF